jgi:hypothetical protein
MADIELIVKIDEEDYKKALEINNCECEWNNMHCCYEAILYGKPLPKKHGRLGDIDWILHKMDTTDAQPCTPSEHYAWDFCKAMLNKIPTIIEADADKERD